MVEKLNETERAELAVSLPNWRLDGEYLKRELKFRDFSEAFDFMVQVAMLAEDANHHPEWSNIYNRVNIALTTHDADGLTRRDTQLAAAIDRLLSS